MLARFAEAVFWISAILFMHTWVTYPLLARLIAKRLAAGSGCRDAAILNPDARLPGVTVVLPVHNGERSIKEKLDNIFSLDYEQSQLEIIVVSDGSTDSTLHVVDAAFGERVTTAELREGGGKSAAQNVGIGMARHGIVLLTDLDARMTPRSLRQMVRHFADPRVGCVGSNVQYAKDGWEVSESHVSYWRSEEFIRMAESSLGVLISICGSAIAIRRELFTKLDHDSGDDFIIPLNMALTGHRTVFAHEAIVLDRWPSEDLKGELRARRRITLRNFLGLIRRRRLLNPFRYPLLSATLISHKVLRWLTPVLLLVMALTSLVLARSSSFFEAVVLLQALGYGAAVFGMVGIVQRRRIALASQLGSFLWANIGVAWGLISLANGVRIHRYSVSGRAPTAAG